MIASLTIQWGSALSRVDITLPTIMQIRSATGILRGTMTAVNIIVYGTSWFQSALHFKDSSSEAVPVIWLAIGT